MKRLILLATAAGLLAPTVATAKCVNVPDRGSANYMECMLTKTVREPGAELIISFPRNDPDPTFNIYLEWLPAERCRKSDPNRGRWPYCHEEDQCLLYVEVTRLPPLDTGGHALIDGAFYLNSAVSGPHVHGGNWTNQVVASNTETLRSQDHAVRFDNGACWAAMHFKYAKRLTLLYK